MNSNRLSTKLSRAIVDRDQLILKAEELLNKGSNYEHLSNGMILIKSTNKFLKGLRKKILVKDENGNILYEFESMEKCGNYFNVSHQTIRRRLRENKPLEYKGQNIYFY